MSAPAAAGGFGLVEVSYDDGGVKRIAGYGLVSMDGDTPAAPVLAMVRIKPDVPAERQLIRFLGQFEIVTEAKGRNKLERAREAYRLSVALVGAPAMTGAELARMFDENERWGQRRVREVLDGNR